jgi:acetyl esterase/lipase
MSRSAVALGWLALTVLFFGVRGAAAAEVTLGDVGLKEIADARPGQILRIWPQVGGSVGAGKAYRILYRSTGRNGAPIAVSGAVFIPDAPPPREGRDIVAWAHPTTGVVGRCAPTLLPDLSGTIPGLAEMLERGYVVAATDYAGLGTPGIHPYLIGDSEARAVLDSVRAARELPDAQAGKRFAVWGHSQGGHAALFTGQRAAAYAPELQLVGVAVAAPATYLAELFDADHTTLAGKTLSAMALLSWSKVFDVPLDTILAAKAHAGFERVAGDCIQSIAEMLKIEQDTQALQTNFLTANPTKEQPWKSIMARNSPGQRPAGAPVFIAQGTADDVVRPVITKRFAEHLCRKGTPVHMTLIEGASHSFAGMDSARTAVKWMAERFAGRPAPSDCR